MTEQRMDDAFWSDPFVQQLGSYAKLLFLYLWTNKRRNSAAVYDITPKTIAFETSIPEPDITAAFAELEPKVKWLPDANLVWVKNYVRRQPKSPLFLKSVSMCLANVSNNGLVSEVIEYNLALGIELPYVVNGISTVGQPLSKGISTVLRGYSTSLEVLEKDRVNRESYEVRLPKDDTTKETPQLSKELRKYPFEYVALRKEVFEGLKQRRGYVSRNGAAEAGAMSRMFAEGFTPEQILYAYDIIKTQPFFKGKALTMLHVYKEIYEVLRDGKDTGHAKKIAHHKAYPRPDEYQGRA